MLGGNVSFHTSDPTCSKDLHFKRSYSNSCAGQPYHVQKGKVSLNFYQDDENNSRHPIKRQRTSNELVNNPDSGYFDEVGSTELKRKSPLPAGGNILEYRPSKRTAHGDNTYTSYVYQPISSESEKSVTLWSGKLKIDGGYDSNDGNNNNSNQHTKEHSSLETKLQTSAATPHTTTSIPIPGMYSLSSQLNDVRYFPKSSVYCMALVKREPQPSLAETITHSYLKEQIKQMNGNVNESVSTMDVE